MINCNGFTTSIPSGCSNLLVIAQSHNSPSGTDPKYYTGNGYTWDHPNPNAQPPERTWKDVEDSRQRAANQYQNELKAQKERADYEQYQKDREKMDAAYRQAGLLEAERNQKQKEADRVANFGKNYHNLLLAYGAGLKRGELPSGPFLTDLKTKIRALDFSVSKIEDPELKWRSEGAVYTLLKDFEANKHLGFYIDRVKALGLMPATEVTDKNKLANGQFINQVQALGAAPTLRPLNVNQVVNSSNVNPSSIANAVNIINAGTAAQLDARGKIIADAVKAADSSKANKASGTIPRPVSRPRPAKKPLPKPKGRGR